MPHDAQHNQIAPTPLPTLELGDAAALSAGERVQLAAANLDDVAPIEVWAATGTNRQNAYATHGIFRYYGKFPPPVGRYLIQTFSSPEELVWDPMCGSGTTGVEARLLNRHSELRDVSPLSLLAARVKSRFVDRAPLEQAVQAVKEAYAPCKVAQYPVEPVGLRNPEHWFLPRTSDSLRGLHRAITGVAASEPEVGDFLWLIFAGTVRKVSRATTQQGRLFLDAASAREDAWLHFSKQAQKGIDRVTGLPKNGAVINVEAHDLRQPLEPRHHGHAPLVIMHPPYFTNYRYSRVNSLELAWLGHTHASVRRQEVREYFKNGDPQKVKNYVADMTRAVLNASQVLRPDGVLALMIGDTRLRDTHIPATRMLLDAVCEEAAHISSSITVEKVAVRVPRFTEASWVASQRRTQDDLGVSLRDYVIILRKGAT